MLYFPSYTPHKYRLCQQDFKQADIDFLFFNQQIFLNFKEISFFYISLHKKSGGSRRNRRKIYILCINRFRLVELVE